MICFDASVAAKWVLPEDYSTEALSLLDSTLRAGEPIVAPPLLPFEVNNIIRQRMRRAALPYVAADEYLADFLDVPVTLIAPPRLYREALRLATEHNLAAVYDAHYVVVAQTLGCDLWTDDRRLLRALNNELPFVRWIGDAQAG